MVVTWVSSPLFGMRLLQALLFKCQPRLPLVYSVSADAALPTEWLPGSIYQVQSPSSDSRKAGIVSGHPLGSWNGKLPQKADESLADQRRRMQGEATELMIRGISQAYMTIWLWRHQTLFWKLQEVATHQTKDWGAKERGYHLLKLSKFKSILLTVFCSFYDPVTFRRYYIHHSVYLCLRSFTLLPFISVQLPVFSILQRKYTLSRDIGLLSHERKSRIPSTITLEVWTDS